MQTALPGNKQFFISLTQTATSQADGSAHVVIRGRMLCQATCQDPPPNRFSVMSLDQLHCKMPERHKKFIRDAVCLFCHSSHLTGLLKKKQERQSYRCKPPVSLVLLWFLNGRTCGRSACYRSRRVKARKPPLAGWAGRERDAPAGERRSAPDMQGPGAERCSAATLEVVAGCAASSHPGLSST